MNHSVSPEKCSASWPGTSPTLSSFSTIEDEWWFAPLDDNLPIVRLNRTGLEMLQAMNGHTTVGALVEKYGTQVCGPDGQPGQWHWNIGLCPPIPSVTTV